MYYFHFVFGRNGRSFNQEVCGYLRIGKDLPSLYLAAYLLAKGTSPRWALLAI